MWVEIHKGNQFEMDFGKDAKANLDLTKYNAASRMLDIESFHTFIHYLIARGPGGDHDGKVWDTRQKHWRETVQINKKMTLMSPTGGPPVPETKTYFLLTHPLNRCKTSYRRM